MSRLLEPLDEISGIYKQNTLERVLFVSALCFLLFEDAAGTSLFLSVCISSNTTEKFKMISYMEIPHTK